MQILWFDCTHKSIYGIQLESIRIEPNNHPRGEFLLMVCFVSVCPSVHRQLSVLGMQAVAKPTRKRKHLHTFIE